MKVTVLVENTACRENVTAQHGLSLYVETNGRRILFDMGQDDSFARNAALLGIDLAGVDFAVLSHGHYDHGGGLKTFLQINQTAPVYVHQGAFAAYYNGTHKYIGLDSSFQNHSRLIVTQGVTVLPDGMKLKDCNDLGWPINSWGLNRKDADAFTADDFYHEQYLEICEGQRRYLISGCSHKGIVNIAEYFQPDVLIGGFHLSKQEDETQLQKIAESLHNGHTVYYTGHCTGDRQFRFLKGIMGDCLQSLSTGKIIEA